MKMIKTPDEFMKTLERCYTCTPCGDGEQECPYDCGSEDCIFHLLYDAHAYIQQVEAKVPRWISVEEQPPVWPCVVYDGHNPPYTPRGCIAMIHDADGKVNWIPEVPLADLMKGRMPELHNFPITHWMPLPELPEE